MNRVVVVVPTYNSRIFLDECLAAVFRQESVEIDVAVVDNGSTDGSTEHVRGAWPSVHVFEMQANMGYGVAVNKGTSLARNSRNAHVLALNPDAILGAAALRQMIDALHDDSSVGAVGPRLVNPSGVLQVSAHKFPSVARLFAEAIGLDRLPIIGRFVGYHDRTYRYDVRRSVDWVDGAVLLVRNEAWHQSGGFDPAYFFFVEEVDLQWRLAQLGWRVVVEPKAVAKHYGGKRPIPAETFLHSHSGMERFIYLRNGLLASVAARVALCLTALTRAAGWSVVSIVVPGRRAGARRWAQMFARVFWRSFLSLWRDPPRARRGSSDVVP